MELKGAMDCFKFLKVAGLCIDIFVSDRHRSIAKWIRENQPGTKHFLDIWHVAKRCYRLARKMGVKKIKEWIKSVRKHLYCCATSTSQGFGDLIVAKWTSYLRHVNNKHSNHPPRPSLPEMCSWRNVIKIMDKEWSVDSLMINKNHNDHNDHKHFPSPYSSSFLFESICINSKSY